MFDSLIVFADAAPQAGDGGFFFFFVMLPLLLIIIWLFIMGPQRRQEDRLRKMLNSLEKNDRVMTVGGLIGTIHIIDRDQNEVVLKVDESNNTKIRFHLTAVSTVFPKENKENSGT